MIINGTLSHSPRLARTLLDVSVGSVRANEKSTVRLRGEKKKHVKRVRPAFMSRNMPVYTSLYLLISSYFFSYLRDKAEELVTSLSSSETNLY